MKVYFCFCFCLLARLVNDNQDSIKLDFRVSRCWAYGGFTARRCQRDTVGSLAAVINPSALPLNLIPYALLVARADTLAYVLP